MILADDTDPLDAALSEYLERARSGETLTPEAFAASRPELREALLSLLPGVLALENLKAEAAPPVSAAPARLGEFELRRELGRGGMGAVYEAWQPSLGRVVALKRLTPALAADPRCRERFLAEARTLAGLYHPHIVPLHGAGTDGAELFFVMEYVDGESLDRLPREALGATPEARERRVAELGRCAAEALVYAHSRRVLHRDVKPANLLLDGRGVLRVGDFGLAAVMDAGAGAAMSRTEAGTPRYLAPERLRGESASPASDQYSLGVTLHELLTGRPVFEAASTAALLSRILSERVPAAPGAPELAAVLAKATAPEPAERYPDLAAMAEDLRRFLDGRPVVARSPSPWRRLAFRARRHPVAATLATLCVALILTCLTVLAVAYVRVSDERARAEANARVAQSALDRIFAHFDSPAATAYAPVSPESARLLDELLPYYTAIGGDSETPAARLAEVTLILARLQVRAGRPAAALDTFDRAVARYSALPDGAPVAASAKLMKADALKRLGRDADAEALRREVASTPPAPGGDPAVIRALLDIAAERRPEDGGPRRDDDPDLVRATALLTPLLSAAPQSPALRFSQSRLLDLYPPAGDAFRRAGLPHDPVAVLESLVRECPREPGYRLELSRALAKAPARRRPDAATVERLASAATEADRLLTDFPGEGVALQNAFEIHLRRAEILHRGDDAEAARLALTRAGLLLNLMRRGDPESSARAEAAGRRYDEALRRFED